MPDISLAIALLKKPMEALASTATGRIKDLMARLKTERNIKTVYQKLSSTQKVKTIWNVDRALTISSFYFPASITTPTGKTQQITGVDDFPANHVVLEGIVGQGKSILLRWLLGREARSGSRIPVFIELRRVPTGQFDNFVLKVFSELVGAVPDEDLFSFFADQGKLSLLLDGFDELDPANVTEIATSVERLAQLHPAMRIIITSRPDNGIQKSALFDVVPIARLTPDKLPGFFSKILSRDKELAARLIAATAASKGIAELVSTPLLATLLTIVYRAHQKIPLDFSEFYDELFQILLVRHDRSKIAYERHRKTKLSDRHIQEIFEAFCFKTKALSKSSVERQEALAIVSQAVDAAKMECDPSNFLDDIERVTCLLSEEGGRVEFLHQSVQEFFAARYVKGRPEGVALKFYEQLSEKYRWLNWQQELSFLAQIDRYRSSKYFFIPALTETLDYLDSSSAAADGRILRDRTSDKLAVRQDTVARDGSPLPSNRYYVVNLPRVPRYLLSVFDSRAFSLLFSDPAWRKAFDSTTHGQQLTYSQIADKIGVGAELGSVLTGTVNYLLVELKNHRAAVQAFDDTQAFANL